MVLTEQSRTQRLERRARRIDAGKTTCRCMGCRGGHMEIVVYFMREPDGPVKIGITHVGAYDATVFTVEQRRRSVERASGRRMVLLGTVPGSRARETDLHRRFAHLRTVGEWFRPAPELLDYIASTTAGGH